MAIARDELMRLALIREVRQPETDEEKLENTDVSSATVQLVVDADKVPAFKIAHIPWQDTFEDSIG